MLYGSAGAIVASVPEAVKRMSFKHGGKGGAIVNVSSAASRLGAPGEYVDYAASKGALEDIVDEVSAALDGWADPEALTMHPLRIALVRIMDDPSGGLHGVIQAEALVEA